MSLWWSGFADYDEKQNLKPSKILQKDLNSWANPLEASFVSFNGNVELFFYTLYYTIFVCKIRFMKLLILLWPCCSNIGVLEVVSLCHHPANQNILLQSVRQSKYFASIRAPIISFCFNLCANHAQSIKAVGLMLAWYLASTAAALAVSGATGLPYEPPSRRRMPIAPMLLLLYAISDKKIKTRNR